MINKDFNEIILHCTATPEGINFKPETISEWHVKEGLVKKDRKLPEGNYNMGYHYLVDLKGAIHKGTPLTQIGSHCASRKHGASKSMNFYSISISYLGGCVDKECKIAKDTRTKSQKQSIDKLIRELVTTYPQLKKLSGHNDYSAKDCPSFKVSEQYQHLKDIIEV